jgi:hypothetical protein
VIYISVEEVKTLAYVLVLRLQSIKNEAYILHLYSLFQEYSKMSPRIMDAPVSQREEKSTNLSILTQGI